MKVPSAQLNGDPPVHVILFQPEIPQNTGNVGRLCAYNALRLHLIHPLGFRITDRHLRRSGMDYWKELDLVEHSDWPSFLSSPKGPKRLWLLSTRGERTIWETSFLQGDGLVFGNEGHGAPDWLHEEIGNERRICIPRFGPTLRSLNLSTSVGIAAYEALRQMQGLNQM